MKEKKVGIVTFHRACNYGAVLQCYALNKTISNMGIKCETIDYWPTYFKNLYYMRKPFKLLHPPVKTIIRRFQVKDVLRKRNEAFESFVHNFIPLSKSRFHDLSDLNKIELDYDIYITGSDQVWNDGCAHFDPVYFLDFMAADRKKKYSYAASFGFDQVPESLYTEYQRRLSGFCDFSVREENGKAIIDHLVGRTASLCCDPTLLLTLEEWSSIAEQPKKNDDYILVYYVTKTKTLQKVAERLAQEKNCKVICVPCNNKFDVLNGKNDKEFDLELRNDCSPQEFITLFKNAKYVITNSFHGTVFSILFHKKFMVQIKLDNGKMNGRASAMLGQVHLEDRALDVDHILEIDNPIDWENVEESISAIREAGKEYLRQILSIKNIRELPSLYEKKENCCGCTACYAICPSQAISMQPDEEGFLYPIIDHTSCIRCYQCLNVCAFKENQKRRDFIEQSEVNCSV